MTAPTGEIYEFEGQEYHVQPKVMSRQCIDALTRLYKHQCRQSLVELQGEKSEWPFELYEEQKQVLMKARISPGFEEAVKAMQTPEGLVVCLEICCDEIESRKEARDLISRIPNLMSTFQSVAVSMAEDLAAAKNSLPQSPTESLASKSEN